MQEQISLSHRVNTVLATGGFAAMTIAAWNYAETRVREETAYEVRMAAQTQAGQVSPAQLVNRTSMYSESTYRTFSQAKTNAAKVAGVLEARRILDPRAEHCEDCPELASEEWERIEVVVPIGESACGPRCRCFIQYRRNAGEQPDETPLPQVPRQSPAQVILPPAA
jgi:cytochrome bd-type quinol oxidase subunit 1